MGKKKVPLFFQKSQNVRRMETIETIDSSLHYHDCYQHVLFLLSIHGYHSINIVINW